VIVTLMRALSLPVRRIDHTGKLHPMRHQLPFVASGTATFPNHHFRFTDVDDTTKVLADFRVKPYPENLYWHDPYFVAGDPAATEKNLAVLTPEERNKYDTWRKTLLFSEQYKNVTGRSYLSNYLRKPPRHFMWRADYIGQQHWITSTETHFTTDVLGPETEGQLEEIEEIGKKRVLKPGEPRLLSQYRDPAEGGVLNMTLTVLSCAPRVFEIKNFLSEAEVAHILKIAAQVDLRLSTTGQTFPGEKKVAEDSRRTRTSKNTWVPRERTAVFDAIYRRAADLMRIDEALLRYRDVDEQTDFSGQRSLGEHLQLVHYDPGQEYTAVSYFQMILHYFAVSPCAVTSSFSFRCLC
jgi:hypothetical protein